MVMQQGGGQIGGTILVKVLMEGGTVPGAGSGSPPKPPGSGGSGGGRGGGGGYGGGDKKHTEQQGVMIDWLKKIGLGVTVGGLLKQSKIASGILGAIWQILGALVDVLLMPLVPLLVRMVGRLAQLVPFIMKLFTDPKAAMKDAWNYFKGMIKAWFTGDVKKFLPDLLLAIIGFFAAKAIISKGVGGLAQGAMGMMGMGGGGMGHGMGRCGCCGPGMMGGMGGGMGRGGPGMARTVRLGRAASMMGGVGMMAGAIMPIMMGALAAGLVIKLLKVDQLVASIFKTPDDVQETHSFEERERTKEAEDKSKAATGLGKGLETVTEILGNPKNFAWMTEEDDYDPQKEAVLVAAMNRRAERAQLYTQAQGDISFRDYAMDSAAHLGGRPMEVINTLDLIQQEIKGMQMTHGVIGVPKSEINQGFVAMRDLEGSLRSGDFWDRYGPDWKPEKEIKEWDINDFIGRLEAKYISGKTGEKADLTKSFLMTKMVEDEQGHMVPLASLLTMQNMGGATLQEVIIRLEKGQSLTGDANARLIAEQRRSDGELYEIDRAYLPFQDIPGR